jgi:hypothetical protein
MAPEHEWSPGNPRCIHCGTPSAIHSQQPQPCVPRWSQTEALRPEPARREYAIDAVDTIHARLAELEADRREALNRLTEEEGVHH